MEAAQQTASQPAPTGQPPKIAPAPFKNEPKKSQPVLMPDRIGLADEKRQDWVVDVPIDVTLEQAMEPSYWAHVAERMEPYDQIQLRSEDGSWVAFLMVSSCERNYAKVVLDRVLELDPDRSAPAGSIKHRVDWKGPHQKYCVIRNLDDKVLKDGFRRKQEAQSWLVDHERTVSK